MCRLQSGWCTTIVRKVGRAEKNSRRSFFFVSGGKSVNEPTWNTTRQFSEFNRASGDKNWLFFAIRSTFASVTSTGTQLSLPSRSAKCNAEFPSKFVSFTFAPFSAKYRRISTSYSATFFLPGLPTMAHHKKAVFPSRSLLSISAPYSLLVSKIPTFSTNSRLMLKAAILSDKHTAVISGVKPWESAWFT